MKPRSLSAWPASTRAANRGASLVAKWDATGALSFKSITSPVTQPEPPAPTALCPFNGAPPDRAAVNARPRALPLSASYPF